VVFFDSSNPGVSKEVVSLLPSSDPISDDTVVVQEVRKSSEGHSVSIFKVTKSAPNTPKLKRHKFPKQQPALVLSSDSENEQSSSQNVTTKSGQSQLLEKLQMSLSNSEKKDIAQPVTAHKTCVKPKTETDVGNLKEKFAGKSPIYNDELSTSTPILKHNVKPVNSNLGKFSTAPRSRSSLRTPSKQKLRHWASTNVTPLNRNIQTAYHSSPNLQSYKQRPMAGTVPRPSKTRPIIDRMQTSMNETPRTRDDADGNAYKRYSVTYKSCLEI